MAVSQIPLFARQGERSSHVGLILNRGTPVVAGQEVAGPPANRPLLTLLTQFLQGPLVQQVIALLLQQLLARLQAAQQGGVKE